jgi:ABC-type transport system substrate-binding protein
MRRLGVTVPAALLVAAACTSPAREVQPVGGGRLVVHLTEPEVLVPTGVTGSAAAQVVMLLFTGLFGLDPDTSRPVPEMAESLVTADNVRWTVTIKPGWTFHDGTPVTAQSYADAWNHGAYAPNGQAHVHLYERIAGWTDLQARPGEHPRDKPPKVRTMSGLKVVDPRTLEVTLTGPFSQFPFLLAHSAFAPMPARAFAGMKTYQEAPVGNGPYRTAGRWLHDRSLTLTRYDGYRGHRPGPDTIEFRIARSDELGYAAFRDGTVDVVAPVPAENMAEARRDYPDRYVERPGPRLAYLSFPSADPRFRNRALRQALSLAIDRERIAGTALLGSRAPLHALPAYSLVPPGGYGGRADACRYCRYDPAEARRLFRAAGGFRGTLRIWFFGAGRPDPWLQDVAAQWQEVLAITDIGFEGTNEYGVDPARTDGPFRRDWRADYASAREPLQRFASGGWLRYRDPRLDALVAAGDRAASVEEALARYQQAEDVVLDGMAAIPIFFSRSTAVHSERVRGLTVDALGRLRLQDVQVLQHQPGAR